MHQVSDVTLKTSNQHFSKNPVKNSCLTLEVEQPLNIPIKNDLRELYNKNIHMRNKRSLYYANEETNNSV